MDHTSVDIYWVIDVFLLLLIGVGPKIALVPFLEITAPLDDKTKAAIVRKMLVTAGVVALLLIGLGELLARLLHFSTGSSIGGRWPHSGDYRHHDGARVRRTEGRFGHRGAGSTSGGHVPSCRPLPPEPCRHRDTGDPLSRGGLSFGVRPGAGPARCRSGPGCRHISVGQPHQRPSR